jgi:hypothetical protein
MLTMTLMDGWPLEEGLPPSRGGDHTLGRRGSHLTRSRFGWRAAVAVLAVLSGWLGCGEPAEPAPAPLETPADAEPAPEAARAPVDPDAALLDRYPSLVFYPAIGNELVAALTQGGSPRKILDGLAVTFAPWRWPSASDWDRSGFIDTDAEAPGFVTRTYARSVSQPTGRHDLGCAGGFLEGVRMILAPRLGVAELEHCDATTLAIEGGPERCDQEREFGRIAIANIARTLPDDRLASGATLVELRADAGTHAVLAKPGALHLCTVSHRAATRRRDRYFHHMLIALGETDGLWVFDTTGVKGVAIEKMEVDRFIRYCTTLLGSNREYRYIADTARLTCVAVTG